MNISTPQNYQRIKHYPFIDGFRGIALLAVLLHHVYYFFGLYDSHIYPLFITQIAATGCFGVDMFFVISGFLITGILIDSYDKDILLKRFLIRRAFKIIPQYVLCVLFGLWTMYTLQDCDLKILESLKVTDTSGHFQIKFLWEHLLFLQNYVPAVPTLGHTWSLAVELN